MPEQITVLSALLPVVDGTLTLGPDAAPGPVLADQLDRLTNGTPIVVRNAVRTEDAAAVQVTGTASVMGVADLPVTATATATGTAGAAGAAGVLVTVRFALPAAPAWRFSTSFPDLPAFNAGPPGVKSGTPPAPVNLLDRLLLSDAAFVLATAAPATDAVTGAPLGAGLNFVARWRPTGWLGLLEGLVGEDAPLALYGPVVVPRAAERTLPLPPSPLMQFPWQLPAPIPGIHLAAQLGGDRTVGGALLFSGAGIRIYSPPSGAWAGANPTYPPVMGAVGKLAVPSAGLTLKLTALGLAAPSSLTLFGTFEGVSLGNLAHLADLAGPGDLAAQLPEDVRAAVTKLDALALEAVTLRLGPGLHVTGVDVAVGLPGLDTRVVPGFTLQDLVARFGIDDPFGPGRQLSLDLGGSFEFLDAAFEADLTLPDVTATGYLTGAATLPLSRLFAAMGLPAPPDLTVNALQVGVEGDGSYAVAAGLANDPAWTLDLGPAPLTVSDVTVLAARPAQGAASGSVSGRIALGDALDLDLAYATPGDFLLRAEVPEVRLQQLVGALTDQHIALPSGFDLDFVDGSVLIQKSGSDLVFLFATTMKDLGTVAFEVRRVAAGAGGWGFAAGLDLAAPRLSALPGLSALAGFEQLFKLDELVVVAASFQDPAFSFPELAVFNSPAIGTGTVKLPAQASGVIPGLNIYGRWTLDTSREQKLLQQLLGLHPTLGVTLQVGANPSADSRLYVSYDTTLQKQKLSCRFGGQIQDGGVGLFLTGVLEAVIQQQPVRFDVTLLFVPNGALIAGSMLGSIGFHGVTLSNLALAVGVDWEGLPSLGIAASIAVDHFDSSVAVFFDSTDPARSMLAGSVSKLTLRDVVDTFAGKVVPSSVDGVLARVALVGTGDFTVDAGLAAALDERRVDQVSTAFAAHDVTVPATLSQVVLTVGKAGESWFLTDLSTMLHYQLEKQADGIHVSLEPQLQVVPEATQIGKLHFDQGIQLSAGLDVFGFHGEARIQVKPTQGIAVDGAMTRVVIGSEALFSIESADGRSGPRVSAATFRQPAQPEPFREPHCLVDGQLNLLGLKRSVFVTASAQGFAFELEGTLVPGFSYDLRGHFDGPTNLGAGGSLTVGVGKLDLGPLGTADIGTGVKGSLDVGVRGADIQAGFDGGFSFAAQALTLPHVALDVKTASLPKLPEALARLVVAELKKFLADAARWLKLVRDQVLTGVQDVGGTLKSVFGATAQQAATLMKGAGYAAGEVGSALKSGYGATAAEAATLLKGAGYAVNDVAGALKSAYGVTGQQAAVILKGAGYAANQVAGALRTAYGATINQAATWLKAAGFGVTAIGDALRGVWGASASAVGTALKGAGFGLSQVGGYLKDAYDLGPAALKSTLQGIGYATDEIANFFNSLGGKFADLFKKMDPTKW